MKQVIISLRILLIFTIILGVIYPLMMTGIAQILFPEKANGSLIISSGSVTGSYLIGQKFISAKYFHGRPSANDYDGLPA
jgi:K+-transporting ATPase ATPase C chain